MLDPGDGHADHGSVDVVAVIKALLDVADMFGSMFEGREGDQAERAATIALVGAVMQHDLFELVRACQRDGTKASVTSTREKFTLEVGRASVDVTCHDEGLLFFFGGDLWGIVPIMQRAQEVPVRAMPFDAAVRMGRELVTRVGAVLEAARRTHAAATR